MTESFDTCWGRVRAVFLDGLLTPGFTMADTLATVPDEYRAIIGRRLLILIDGLEEPGISARVEAALGG